MGLYYSQNPPHIGSQQPLTEREIIPQSGPAPQNPPLIGSRIGQAILNSWIIPVAAIVLPQLMVPQPVQAAIVVPAKPLAQEIYRNWELVSPAPIVARLLSPPIPGPAQNPPLTGAVINPAILNYWNLAPVAIALPATIVPLVVPAANQALRWPAEIYRSWDASPPAPIVARLLTPPVSGASPQNPPVIGAQVPLAVHVAWLAPSPAPITAKNLNPPIGAAASFPPFAGARFATEIEVSWQPAAPAPIVAINLDPPISGSVPQNPPIVGAQVPVAVQIAWLPVSPTPITGPAVAFLPPAPTNPPFNGGAKVSREVLINWLPPAPVPIKGPNFTPGGTAPQNPPFTGARFATEFEIAWLPPIPAAIVGVKLSQSGPLPPPVVPSLPGGNGGSAPKKKNKKQQPIEFRPVPRKGDLPAAYRSAEEDVAPKTLRPAPKPVEKPSFYELIEPELAPEPTMASVPQSNENLSSFGRVLDATEAAVALDPVAREPEPKPDLEALSRIESAITALSDHVQRVNDALAEMMSEHETRRAEDEARRQAEDDDAEMAMLDEYLEQENAMRAQISEMLGQIMTDLKGTKK